MNRTREEQLPASVDDHGPAIVCHDFVLMAVAVADRFIAIGIGIGNKQCQEGQKQKFNWIYHFICFLIAPTMMQYFDLIYDLLFS